MHICTDNIAPWLSMRGMEG